MKTLQEQIAEFEAKGCIAGDRKWKPTQYDNNYELTIAGITFDVTYDEGKDKTSEFSIYNSKDLYVTSTTLEEALIEALDIVKSKVIDLAKELGLVVIDTSKIINKESLNDTPDFSKDWQKLNNERYTFKGKRTDNGQWVQGQFESISKQYQLRRS